MQPHHQSKAIGKYIRLSSSKVNRILNEIRGKKYEEARLMLEFMPYKACHVIHKVLESAVSNAITQNTANKNSLVIKEAFVNQGPTLKRFQPRAQGRAFPIRKPTCHITIIVTSI